MARPKIEVRYKYACGCYYKKPRRNSSANFYYPCPVHGEDLLCKLYQCQHCGEWVERSIKTSRFRYCTECKIKLGIHAEEPVSISESSTTAPPRKYDCKHYLDCINVNGALFKNAKACQGCARYRHEDLDAADYLDNHRYSERTLFNSFAAAGTE